MGNWFQSSSLEPSPLLKQHGPRGEALEKLLCEVHSAAVPPNRGSLWGRCLCVDSLRELERQDLFQHLLDLPLDDERVIYAEVCIQKDLDRVFPHCFGQARAEYCRKKYLVLLAYAQRCPEIGYEGGMHFIVGVLLAVMDTEEAFWCFCSIIEKMLPAGFFSLGDPVSDSFVIELELFGQLLESTCPDLAAHLAHLQVGTELVLVSWYKSFFMCLEAPHDVKLRLLDALFLQGLDGLHHISLLLLKAERSRFLQCQTFEEAVQLLAVLPIDYNGCNFLEASVAFPLQQRREEVIGVKGRHPRALTRSYEISWSIQDHWRMPCRHQRVVMLLLMAMTWPGTSSSSLLQLPKALWINRILPFT